MLSLQRSAAFATAALTVNLALASCATVDGVTTSVIAEKRVEHVIRGQGTPTVVFENGLGAHIEWWAKILPEVARESRIFAYNRPGTGASAVSSTPRDGGTIVEELRRTLRGTGIAPPYVLVGHSLGGLYMQLFARAYPQEVAGLVLVDSTHPEQMKGAGAREHWPTWLKLTLDVTTSAAAQKELDVVPVTGAQMLALPPFAGEPVIVLSAKGPMSETSAIARDANAKRVDIARLHPGSKQVWVDSGHARPLEKPMAVVDAIREVLSGARTEVHVNDKKP
ncbi:MAG: alpha/beta fold hydrolase [Hyphomicrobiaceae bacterium]|nr:alpha/beta fold hydrolase [Hyphomicrobiaceae bacterium]